MSLLRYRSMAIESPVWAWSCRRTLPYSVPRSRWQGLGASEPLGQGECLALEGFGLCDLREIAPRRMSPRRRSGLVAPFLMLAGKCQRPIGEGLRLLQATGPQLPFSQGDR